MHLFRFLDGDEDRCFGKEKHSQKSRERDAATKETRPRRRFGCAGSEVDLQRLDAFPCRAERLKDDDVARSPEGDANEGVRYCGLSHGASSRLRLDAATPVVSRAAASSCAVEGVGGETGRAERDSERGLQKEVSAGVWETVVDCKPEGEIDETLVAKMACIYNDGKLTTPTNPRLWTGRM